MGDDYVGRFHRLVEPDTAGGFLHEFDPSLYRGRLLLAEARQRGNQTVRQGLSQLRNAGHPEIVIDSLDALGPHTGDNQQVQQGRRDLREQVLMGLDEASPAELLDLGQRGLADPRDLGELPCFEENLNVGGHLPDDACDFPVAVDAKPVLAEDFHDIGHLLEDLTDSGILHADDYIHPGRKSNHQP